MGGEFQTGRWYVERFVSEGPALVPVAQSGLSTEFMRTSNGR